MARLLIGETLLNQFRVENYIAAGGMATIYRVWDLQRGVPLAMKVLHPELASDPAFMARFQREARALQALSHPHIVPFYGLYKAQDLTFLLERYIDGPSLDEFLRGRAGAPLPLREVLVYFKALYTSLGYAHAQGMIHCDVKPGNVLIDQGGHVYLTDFGIARYADVSATTAVMGTPIYMAPEQIRGERVRPETDIYSLGVMLFEMMTGQRPFRSDGDYPNEAGSSPSDRLRYAHLYLPPPDPRSINPALPEALSQVLLKAMAKDPQQRYPNMQAMAEAVFAAVNTRYEALPDRVRLPDEPALEVAAEESAPNAPQEERAYGESTTRPGGGIRQKIPPRLWIALASAVLVVLCLLAGAQMARGLAQNLRGGRGQAGTPTGAVVEVPGGSQQTTPDSTAPVEGDQTPTAESDVGSFTPPGEVAFVQRESGRDRLFMIDGAGSSKRALGGPDGADWDWAPQWSPDGSRLAWVSQYGGDTHILVMTAGESTWTELAAGEAYDKVHSPAWLGDGQRVSFWALGEGSNWLVIADASTGAETDRYQLPVYRNLFVWNWANGLLAYVQNPNQSYQVVMSSSPLTAERPVTTGGEDYAPAWSRDGQWLAFQSGAGRGAGENEIWIVRPDGSDLRQVTFNPAGIWSRAPSWSPDGQYIAYVTNRAGSLRADYGEVFVVEVATAKVVQLTQTGGAVYDWRPAWRPR